MKKIAQRLRYFFLATTLLFIAGSFTQAYYSDEVMVSDMSFTTAVWAPGPATITEVFYDPEGPVADTGREWIELTNTGNFAIDLDGYALHFDGVGSSDFIFSSFSLLPGNRVVVHVRSTGVNSSTDLYWPNTNSINMGNSYGSVGLFKNAAKDPLDMVDFVQYGSGDQDGETKAITAGIWTEDDFVSDVAEGHSIQLVSADNNSASDWFDQITPNPGS